MITISHYIKKYSLHFFLVLIVGLILLYPTFDLALTGDDYLGFWRLEQRRSIGVTDLEHFFTDYGPQDLLTALIHSVVGFNATYYYALAFVLKFLAAISIYPLTVMLTKNRFAGFISSLFFMVSSIGMEILDWSFNMPSYVGIAFMNLSLYFLLKSLSKNYIKNTSISLTFFVVSIVSQPLRLLVLIIIIIGTLSYILIVQKNLWQKIFVSTFLFISMFLILFSQTTYGSAAGVTGGNKGITENITISINDKFEEKGILIFLNPIGQVGNIVFSTSSFPEVFRTLNKIHYIFLIVTTYITFLITIKLLSFNNIKPFTLTGAVWGTIIAGWILPINNISVTTENFFGYLLGGYFLLFVLALILNIDKSNPKKSLGIIIGLLIVTAPILPFWIRNPSEIQPSYSRYLIVPSAGVSILLGIFYNVLDKTKAILIFLVLFMLFNFYEVQKYINNLHAARNQDLANNIRNSIPFNPKLGNTDEPIIYHLEADNSVILYHSLYFGFPFFIHYNLGYMQNPWAFAYTTDWGDIVDAYFTGDSLERFNAVKVEPIKLENIHSLRLEGTNLIDTSETTRTKLKNLERTLTNKP